MPRSAKSRRCAIARRSIWPIPRSRRRAPASVVNFRLQLGEQVKAQTPLFALVTDRRPWLEANFKETDLTHVTVGQKATVILDMHPDITWDAEVESISPATGAEFAILPAQNASGNWVKVVQRLPVRLRLIERPGEPPLRAGMTAYVSIDTGRTRSLSSIFGNGAAVAARPASARDDQSRIDGLRPGVLQRVAQQRVALRDRVQRRHGTSSRAGASIAGADGASSETTCAGSR